MRTVKATQGTRTSFVTVVSGALAALLLLVSSGSSHAQTPSVVFSQANGVIGLGSSPTSIDYQGTAGHMAANARGDLFIPVSANNTDYLEEIPANGGPSVSLLGPSSGAANSTGNAQGVTVDAKGNLYATYSDQGPTYHAAIVYIPLVNGTYATGTQFGNLGSCGAFPVPANTTAPCFVPFTNYLPAATGGYIQPADVAIDAAGDLFIATKYVGGTYNSGTILVIKIPAANPSAASILPINGLSNGGGVEIAVDPAGDVFAADGYGNNFYLAAGASASVSPGGLNYITGVSTDAGGNAYFTSSHGAADSSILVVPAGTGCTSSGCASDYTLTNQLSTNYTTNPSLGVAITGSGKLYFAGSYPNSISSVSVTEFPLGSTAVGTPTGASTLVAFPTTYTVFDHFSVTGPFAVSSTTCNKGQVYFAYSSPVFCSVSVTYTATAPGPQTGTLQEYDPYGNRLGVAYLSGTGLAPTVNIDPGTVSALGSGWTAPSAIAVDNLGNTFVADSGTGKIYKNSSATAVASGFTHPSALAVDSAGDLFVADPARSSVYEVPYNIANGSYSAQITLATGLSGTTGLALDSNGNLFVADSGNSRVLQFSGSAGQPDGSLPSLLGSGFKTPVAVAVDGSGNLYIADTGLDQVIQYNLPNGTQIPILSGLTTPAGVAADADGGLFAADSGTKTIVHIPSISGVLNKNAQVAIATVVPVPNALAVDSTGNLYVADTADARVGLMNRTSGVVNFGNIEMMTSSAGTAATVSNGGTASTTFNSPYYTATGNTTGNIFALQGSSTCANGSTLAPGVACTVASVFTPPAANPYSETLAFSATPATTSTLLLTGTGVNLPKTTTTISNVNPATPTFGQTVIVTATVAPVVAGATPAGTVTFSVDGTPQIPASPLSGTGTASITLTGLSGGPHTITASYNGSSVYAGSTSSIYNLSIGKSNTTTTDVIQSSTVFTNPTSQNPGVTVTFIATVTPSLPGTPTGFVYFYNQGNPTAIGTAPVSPAGTATFNISTLPVGPYNIYAMYQGDSNYNSSTSSPTLSLLISNPTVQISASSGVIYGNGPAVALTLTSVAGFGTVNGTTGAVDLACTGLPAYSACSFSPAVGLTLPNAQGQVALSVVINQAPVIAVPGGLANVPGGRGLRSTLLLMVLLLPAALATLALRRRRLRGLLSTGLGLLLLAGWALTLSGCSGTGTASFATPKGTSTINVTATISAAAGSTTPVVAQTIPLQLIVQ